MFPIKYQSTSRNDSSDLGGDTAMRKILLITGVILSNLDDKVLRKSPIQEVVSLELGVQSFQSVN